MKNKATTIIKKYFFLMALVAMVGGFSAFKASSNVQLQTFLYEVHSDGTIGLPIDENDIDCNLSNGEYCSVELSAPKPSNMESIDEAESSSIWVQTFHREP